MSQVLPVIQDERRVSEIDAPLGGEQEEISEQTFDAGIAEPFPGDLYEDPRVGRYKVSLWQDDESRPVAVQGHLRI